MHLIQDWKAPLFAISFSFLLIPTRISFNLSLASFSSLLISTTFLAVISLIWPCIWNPSSASISNCNLWSCSCLWLTSKVGDCSNYAESYLIKDLSGVIITACTSYWGPEDCWSDFFFFFDDGTKTFSLSAKRFKDKAVRVEVIQDSRNKAFMF